MCRSAPRPGGGRGGGSGCAGKRRKRQAVYRKVRKSSVARGISSGLSSTSMNSFINANVCESEAGRRRRAADEMQGMAGAGEASAAREQSRAHSIRRRGRRAGGRASETTLRARQCSGRPRPRFSWSPGQPAAAY